MNILFVQPACSPHNSESFSECHHHEVRPVRKPLSLELVAAHLQGTSTLGTYALDAQSHARWRCLDADDEPDWLGLMELAHHISTQQVSAYLEGSRRGGRLWLFPEEPLNGQEARRIARQLLADHGLSAVEIYPKQDTLRGGPCPHARVEAPTPPEFTGHTIRITARG